jgi:DNA-binding XRE family transcriptional regulator
VKQLKGGSCSKSVRDFHLVVNCWAFVAWPVFCLRGRMQKTPDTYDTSRGTEMRINAPRFNVTIRIHGRASRRERRAILLAAYRRIAPLFKVVCVTEPEYENGWIAHRDGSWQNAFRDLDRPISMRQAVKTRTQRQKLGFEIRMRRLKQGRSQEALAAAANINRSHLSRIERGHCQVKLSTLACIERVLNGQQAPNN